MKYFLKNTIVICMTICFLILLFTNPDVSKQSIINSFNLWINKIVPSLFPMIIINDILINYNFSKIICFIFYKLFNKIFKLSYNGTYLFIMSMFTGTPSNAILMNDLHKKGMISNEECNKLIYVLYFSNPLFLYNMLSLIFNKYIVIKLIIIHYLSNFIILFIKSNKCNVKCNNKTIYQSIPLNKLITHSISKAINSMITILGIISFYMLITNYLKNNLLLAGILEITTGLNMITYTHTKYKLLLSIIFINFGGLSIFSQIKSILEDTHINFINYFKGRFLQIIISIVISFI